MTEVSMKLLKWLQFLPFGTYRRLSEERCEKFSAAFAYSQTLVSPAPGVYFETTPNCGERIHDLGKTREALLVMADQLDLPAMHKFRSGTLDEMAEALAHELRQRPLPPRASIRGASASLRKHVPIGP